MSGAAFTIRHLTHRGGLVLVRCYRCAHTKVMHAGELDRQGMGKAVLSRMRFQCTNCAARKIEPRFYIAFISNE